MRGDRKKSRFIVKNMLYYVHGLRKYKSGRRKGMKIEKNAKDLMTPIERKKAIQMVRGQTE